MNPIPSPLPEPPESAAPPSPDLPMQGGPDIGPAPAAELRCPRCADHLQRARRTALDRVFCLFVPQLRLRCQAEFCGWQGLVRRDAPGAAAFLHSKPYLPQQVLQPSRMGPAGRPSGEPRLAHFQGPAAPPAFRVSTTGPHSGTAGIAARQQPAHKAGR